MTAQHKSGEAHDPPSPGLTAGTTALLAVSCGTMAASLYYGQPLVGLIGPDLHLRPDLYGLVVTLTQLGYVLGLLFLVPLGDMLESRRLVTVTICLTAGALAAAAAAPNALVFLAMALCIGLFCTALQMLVPLAAHMAPDAIRGRVVGTVMSGLITGILLARPIASLLSEAVGWRGVFGFASAVVLALAALLYFRLPNRAPESRLSYADLIGSMWRLLRDTPILRRRIAYQAPVFAGFSIFWTAVPLELAGLPWSLSQTGIALFALAGAAGALVAPLAGRVADAGYSRSGTGLSLTSVLAGFGFCALAGVTGLWALILGAVLIDAGVQGNQIISQRAIYGLAPEIRSRLNGLFIACSFVAAALGSLLAGAVFAHYGWLGVAVMGALCPVVALAFWVQELLSTRRR